MAKVKSLRLVAFDHIRRNPIPPRDRDELFPKSFEEGVGMLHESPRWSTASMLFEDEQGRKVCLTLFHSADTDDVFLCGDFAGKDNRTIELSSAVEVMVEHVKQVDKPLWRKMLHV